MSTANLIDVWRNPSWEESGPGEAGLALGGDALLVCQLKKRQGGEEGMWGKEEEVVSACREDQNGDIKPIESGEHQCGWNTNKKTDLNQLGDWCSPSSFPPNQVFSNISHITSLITVQYAPIWWFAGHLGPNWTKHQVVYVHFLQPYQPKHAGLSGNIR